MTFRVEDEENDDDDAMATSTNKGSRFKDVKVDQSDAPDSLVKRRKRVLDAIRQKKRLRAYLSGTSSVLKVVFQSSDGATNESMDWTTFVSHLENMKNPYVSVEMLPKHDENKETDGFRNFYQRTKADKDGGSQPWFNATFEVPYCPTTNALPIKHTDVMHLGFGRPKTIWREKHFKKRKIFYECAPNWLQVLSECPPSASNCSTNALQEPDKQSIFDVFSTFFNIAPRPLRNHQEEDQAERVLSSGHWSRRTGTKPSTSSKK